LAQPVRSEAGGGIPCRPNPTATLLAIFLRCSASCTDLILPRVVFKTATVVHRSLSGNAPSYLADDCQLVADARVRQLRSADTRTLVVSRTRNSFRDKTFAAAGPQMWNSLPPNLRLWAVIRGQFRRLLKTFLFGQ